jgi:hypothetical protein
VAKKATTARSVPKGSTAAKKAAAAKGAKANASLVSKAGVTNEF